MKFKKNKNSKIQCYRAIYIDWSFNNKDLLRYKEQLYILKDSALK